VTSCSHKKKRKFITEKRKPSKLPSPLRPSLHLYLFVVSHFSLFSPLPSLSPPPPPPLSFLFSLDSVNETTSDVWISTL
jgi:hypothetical protein